MKLEKKHWMIIGVVVAIIIVWHFFFKKKKTESSYDPNLLIYGGESGYAGVYGSFGNESGYNADQLTNGQPNFESGYRTALSGPVTSRTLRNAGAGAGAKLKPWKGQSGTWYCPYFEDGVWKDRPCKMAAA